MQYRLHLINPSKDFWTFNTPTEEYPHLPKRSIYDNALVSGIELILNELKVLYGDFDIILSDEVVQCESLQEMHLVWQYGDRYNPSNGGNWYKINRDFIGWLCPVLFDYFFPNPEHLYIYIVRSKL